MAEMRVPSSTDPIRVFIVDDHPVVRNGLRSLLNQYPDIEVIGDAETSAEAFDRIAELRPDISLLDIRLDKEDGLVLARRILRKSPEAHIIALTSYSDESYLVEAARIGVDGYLLKSTSPELIANTIRAVCRGEKCLSSAMSEKAFSMLKEQSREIANLKSGLTDEDMKVLLLIANGLQVNEIADELFISERTVKRRIQDILTKLGVKTRAQAIAEAYERGLL
ncbi:MAG: response regulator transcription factor [Actinobacteria bacterium]|nr:response regulator transcription factor [Actinomycetota bacterium]